MRRAPLVAVVLTALCLVRPLQGAIVPDGPAFDEAFEAADLVLGGVIQPTPRQDSVRIPNGGNDFAFTFYADRVILGAAPTPLSPTSFDLKGYNWPSNLVPFESGQSSILWLKSGSPPTLLAVLPPTSRAVPGLGKPALRPLFVTSVLERLKVPFPTMTGTGSLRFIQSELTGGQLRELAASRPAWGTAIDEILGRRDQEMVRVAADAGRFAEAEAILAGMRQQETRNEALGHMAYALIVRRQFQEALELVPRMDMPSSRATWFGAIADMLDRHRIQPEVSAAATEAMVRAYNETPLQFQASGLVDTVASHLVRRGRGDEARELLRQASRRASPTSSGTIVASQVRHGFTDDALDTLMSSSLPNQVSGLASHAETLARSGRVPDAQRFLAKARELVAQIDVRNRPVYLEAIDKAQREIDRVSR